MACYEIKCVQFRITVFTLSVLSFFLQTSADELYRLYRYMLYGSVRTGRVGFNVNASNTLAAVFTATGQDIAALLESASACFVMEPASTKDILKHCKYS